MSVNFHEECKPYLVPIDKISQHPENPNNGDVAVIVDSIAANGFYGTIIAQKSTGYILAGNHRYAALLELGATQAPVMFLDMDYDRARRVLVADNRTSELAVRDTHALEEMLKQIAESEEGLLGTGYDEEGLAELVRLNDIYDHAGFGGGAGSGNGDEADDLYIPTVVVRGFLDGDRAKLFESEEEAEEALLKLRSLGYHVTMGD